MPIRLCWAKTCALNQNSIHAITSQIHARHVSWYVLICVVQVFGMYYVMIRVNTSKYINIHSRQRRFTKPASAVCDLAGLSVFYMVSACPILQGKAVCFSYQTKVTQTSFWRLESTLGPPPHGYELGKCLCDVPKPCPNAGACQEKKPIQRTTRPALALPTPAPRTPAPSTWPPAPMSPPAQSHSLNPATSPAPPPSADPTHPSFTPPLSQGLPTTPPHSLHSSPPPTPPQEPLTHSPPALPPSPAASPSIPAHPSHAHSHDLCAALQGNAGALTRV